jgi:hypothetical protein
LFFDSSKVSLQAVPIAHAATMKEAYENIKITFGKKKNPQYEKYNWNIYGDLRSVARLAAWLHKLLLYSKSVGEQGEKT